MTDPVWAEVRAALLALDQPRLDRVMLAIGLRGDDPTAVETRLREELATASHEVQAFWLGACNCHGQLN